MTTSAVPLNAKPKLSLTGSHFTSERLFKAEMSQIFHKSWVFAGLAEKIPNSGDYFVTDVAGESIIVLRKRSGDIAAYYNVCRHRGTRLCNPDHEKLNEKGQKALSGQFTGHFRGTITCPYHGWSYDLDGKLLGARCMNEVSGFEQSEYPLHRVAVAEWEGFIFLNLSENPPPLKNQFVPIEGKFSAYRMKELRVARHLEYEVNANWKILIQNASECYHCSLVHPALEKVSNSQSGEVDFLEGAFIGGYANLKQGMRSLTFNGRYAAAPIEGVADTDLERIYYYHIFPNMYLSLHPDYVIADTIKPIGVRKTLITCDFLFHPDAMNRPDFRPDEAVEFWDLTNRQDWKICEMTQEGVSSQAYQPGYYSEEEELIYSFDQEYRRAMGTLSF